MKFTKLTLVAMLLALLVCAFAACGGDTQTDAGTDVDSGNETEATPGTDNTETEHEHTIVEKIEEPTCQARGYKREVCSVCEEQLSVKPIDMIDHVAAAPATCTEASVCKFCGVEIAKATGHTLGAITDSKAATATEDGYEKGNCTVCGAEITNVLPAGLTENFNSLEDGAVTSDAMNATGNLAGFTVKVSDANGAFVVVSEGDNKYLSKASDANATLELTDDNGVLMAGKFTVAFDYRLDGDTQNTGVLSIKDGSGAEHRIISAWQGNKLRFASDKGPYFIEDMDPASKTWINISATVDPSTFDYEIAVDGEKVLYTTSENGAHLVWTLSDGEWTSAEANYTEAKTPFADPAGGISRIYMFHFGKTACSIDNLRVSYTSAN